MRRGASWDEEGEWHGMRRGVSWDEEGSGMG